MGGTYGAALGFGGSAFSAYLSAKEAKRQRKFQERMAKTKYQYTMEDMKTAGLNPILAYQGIGGGTPQGAMGHVPDFGSSMAAGAGASAKQTEATTKKGKQQPEINLLKQQQQLIEQQATNAKETQLLIRAQAEKTATEGTSAMWDEALKRMTITRAQHKRDFYKGYFGKPAVYLQEGGASAAAAARAAASMRIGISGLGGKRRK